MGVSLKTQKTLWGRAAGRCAFPGCRVELFFDNESADDPTLVGQNCHIVAASQGGPRFDDTMPETRRDSYANLILLCGMHHTVIDDAANGESNYPVERLHEFKRDHEAWVCDQLGFDREVQEDDEAYASIIDEWQRLAHLDDWLAWSSDILLRGQPQLRAEVHEDIQTLRRWLLNRVWPNRYPDLEVAMENFRRVLEGFHNAFPEHAEEERGGLTTRKFYQIDGWNNERHHLHREYKFHVDVVMDLMSELTRAANLICDKVRKNVFRAYRRADGHLIVQTGPLLDSSWHEFVTRYKDEEVEQTPMFSGLDSFLAERSSRDHVFGSGTEPPVRGG